MTQPGIDVWGRLMRTFEKDLSAPQLLKLNCLARWFQVFEDRALRMESPDDYHEELLRQADELDRQGLITWQEWRDLRLEADAAYLRAVAGDDYPSGFLSRSM